MGKKRKKLEKRLQKIEREIVNLKIDMFHDNETRVRLETELAHYRRKSKWPGGYEPPTRSYKEISDEVALRHYRTQKIRDTFTTCQDEPSTD